MPHRVSTVWRYDQFNQVWILKSPKHTITSVIHAQDRHDSIKCKSPGRRYTQMIASKMERHSNNISKSPSAGYPSRSGRIGEIHRYIARHYPRGGLCICPSEWVRSYLCWQIQSLSNSTTKSPRRPKHSDRNGRR